MIIHFIYIHNKNSTFARVYHNRLRLFIFSILGMKNKRTTFSAYSRICVTVCFKLTCEESSRHELLHASGHPFKVLDHHPIGRVKLIIAGTRGFGT